MSSILWKLFAILHSVVILLALVAMENADFDLGCPLVAPFEDSATIHEQSDEEAPHLESIETQLMENVHQVDDLYIVHEDH